MTLVLENSDKKKIICFYLTVQKLELHNNLMNVKLKYITSKTLNFFSVVELYQVNLSLIIKFQVCP